MKTKILPLKMYFPANLNTWLRAYVEQKISTHNTQNKSAKVMRTFLQTVRKSLFPFKKNFFQGIVNYSKIYPASNLNGDYIEAYKRRC